MRRHVDRELARARLRGGAHLGNDVVTPVAPLARSLIATLSRTAPGARVNYEMLVAEDVSAPFDRTDLAEVMGNLLENATRHAKSRVRIAATTAPEGMTIAVEDDGPGIAKDQRSAALARGGRLDERGEGTGLGLAIVQDVLDAYGWVLHLDDSPLGGLKVCCFGKNSFGRASFRQDPRVSADIAHLAMVASPLAGLPFVSAAANSGISARLIAACRVGEVICAPIRSVT